MTKVQGKVIDDQTRCVHYHEANDIIAIKFKCCGVYYPCYYCHNETADHQSTNWVKNEFDERAILCGICKEELTINEYLNSGNSCPKCESLFNPNCQLHYSLYFEIP